MAGDTASPPTPTPTSMLAGLHCRDNIHLIVGTNPLAASRCNQSLGAGARPILVAPDGSELHYGLQAKIDAGAVKWERKAFEDSDLFRLGRDEVGQVVDAVFVTSGPRDPQSSHISALCRRNRIPVNVVDAPHLCTFSLLSTHTDGPLQIGVTTNGRGCKLASRIRREIASSLPPNLGTACGRLGDVRRRLQAEDRRQKHIEAGDLDDAGEQSAQFNKLIESPAANAQEAEEDARLRRMRWLSQVCEYWPLRRLAGISEADVDELFRAYAATGAVARDTAFNPDPGASTGATASRSRRRGRVILAGSGPGHPDLLTRATFRAMQAADLILADKLVPSGVLDLIPRRTPVRIARKFPGNADAAQQELLDAALAAYREGLTVLRLKQGDPFIYGRGGEEVAFLRGCGVPQDEIVVLPGVTSALSAPLFAGIPPTQRDVADQVLVCTGTGKKGKPPAPPEFVGSRTVVFLMALHRIEGLVRELTTHVELEVNNAGDDDEELAPSSPIKPTRALWPRTTPCAVVERASCPDQRIIRTTLQHVVDAIEAEGSRPPGLLIVGAACQVLHQSEKGRAWVVQDGFRGLDVDDLGIDQIEKLAESSA